jgi:hypothetical protein
MLGYKRRWEVKANEEDVALVLEYRELHLPHLHKRARDLNGVGALTIVDGLLAYGWTSAEIKSSPTIFIKRVREQLDENLQIRMTQDGIPATQSLDVDREPERKQCRKRNRPNPRTFLYGGQTTEICLSPDVIGDDQPRRPSPFTRSSVDTVTGGIVSNATRELPCPDQVINTPNSFWGASGSLPSSSVLVSISETADPPSFLTDQHLMECLNTSGSLPSAPELYMSSEMLNSGIFMADQHLMNFLDTSGGLPSALDMSHEILESESFMTDQHLIGFLNTSSILPSAPELVMSQATSDPGTFMTDEHLIEILNTSGYLLDDLESDMIPKTTNPNMDQWTGFLN